MNWKAVVIGCAIALGILLLLVVVGGFLLYKFTVAPTVYKTISGPGSPRIVVGLGLLSKSEFVSHSQLGTVTDIVEGEFDAKPGLEIGLVGTEGALFLDKNAIQLSSIAFSSSTDRVNIVDVNRDGICEFMNRGAWGTDASLLDHSGKVLWSYGGNPGVDDMAAGDVDGDGVLEFVVGFNGGGGVHLLDASGRMRWRQNDGNVWHVELVDTNGDGKPEIVHSNAGGQMKVRDASGAVIGQSSPGSYLSDFSLCRWPTEKSPLYVLSAEDDTIRVIDFAGKTVVKLDAPKAGALSRAMGTTVKLGGKQPEHFAVLVQFKMKGAILYVYNPAGKLVYEEILPNGSSITAVSAAANSGAERLFVGGEGKVWMYATPSEPGD